MKRERLGLPRRGLPRRQARGAGLAAVEFALMLPILLLLFMGVVDVARAVQTNMILINLSREGANLAERGGFSLSDGAQVVMGKVTETAPPLDMNNRGMMYITTVMGVKSGSVIRSVVQAQYRWDDALNNLGYRVSGYNPGSKVWACSSWSSSNVGACVVPTGTGAPSVTLMSGTLAEGELIYVVECYYKFNMAFSGFALGPVAMPVIGPNLYSMTVF